MPTETYMAETLQRFPLRNGCKLPNADGIVGCVIHNRGIKRAPSPLVISPSPQRAQRICQPIPNTTIRQSKPSVKICNRISTTEPKLQATWDEVLNTGCRSKSLSSPVSSSRVDSNTAVVDTAAVMAATTQEPVQQTSAGILEVPCNATASPNNTTSTTSTSHSNNANGNRNKDNDDNNCRSRQQERITEAATIPPPSAMPAASEREFMTFERFRLGDQINLLLFDPYRTLKFLITELKSRLRTVVPDDTNVQKILVEIQQTMKRIRIPNATEPLQPPSLRMTATATTTEAEAAVVECILPKERCYVIKEDPLINHARKVNSSCQTIVPELENVNACQVCEHQVKQSTAGCNQKRMNGNINTEDMVMMENTKQQRPKDHRKGRELEKHFSCKSLQDAIENLKIKSNPFSDDTQKIITQLETELSNFQHELRRTSCSSSSHRPPGIKSTTENLKVQCKRLLDVGKENPEQQEEPEETFLDFIANRPPTSSMHSKKLNSSTQVATETISKESQTNLKSSTQMFSHLEKQKLLLLQQFRESEMQNIQGELSELHVFIKDQLDSIHNSITRENINIKYNSLNGRKVHRSKKSHQKFRHTIQGTEKTPTTRPLPLSSPSLTALTSSVLSSTEVGVTSTESSILQGHYKKSSPNPVAPDDGNANNTKSMLKQKHKQKSSSSSLSAADAKESHNISDVDKANKVLGEKKSECHHNSQHHLFAHINCCAPVFTDTPFCSGKKMHFSAVECKGFCPHTVMDDKVQRMMTTDAARTSTHTDIKSTKKTTLPAMNCHQHRQQCHHQPTTTVSAAQEQTQLMSSSLPVEAVPPFITIQSAADQTALNLEAVTNPAVRTIIEKAYASAATAVQHSDGIRKHKHRQSYPTHNSWQRVNLKNPTGCQLKKQICGDGYECRINNNYNDNRSNYPEIHDCQKCRANSINPFCGLCSAEMHEVGADNAPASTTDDDGGDRVDGGAGGDGTIYCDEGNEGATVLEDFTCHTGQRKQAEKLHSCAAKAPFQTDLEEFKAFLDEIVISTPRLK